MVEEPIKTNERTEEGFFRKYGWLIAVICGVLSLLFLFGTILQFKQKIPDGEDVKKVITAVNLTYFFSHSHSYNWTIFVTIGLLIGGSICVVLQRFKKGFASAASMLFFLVIPMMALEAEFFQYNSNIEYLSSVELSWGAMCTIAFAVIAAVMCLSVEFSDNPIITRQITEDGILIAAAFILNLIRIYKVPGQGGSPAAAASASKPEPVSAKQAGTGGIPARTGARDCTGGRRMKQTHRSGTRTGGLLLPAALALLLVSSAVRPLPALPQGASVAQTPSVPQRATGTQEATLDSVCRSLTEHPVTAGTFVMQRRIASLPRDLRSSGSFVICGEGIAWNTLRPVHTLLAVTGDKIIQRLPDGSTNVMDGAGNQTFKSIAATLSALFSGDRAALEDNFQVSFSPAGSSWTMTLLPKDRSVASVMTTIIMEGTQGAPAGTAATGGNVPDKTAPGGGKSGGTPAETAATDGNAPHTTAPDAGEAFLTALSIDEAGGGRITYRFSDQEHRDTLTPDEKAYFTAD